MTGESFGPVDEYGVPTEIFGVHHPDFFPLLGRVIALSSVVERNTRTLAQKLVAPGACDVARDRTSDVVKQAKKGLAAVRDDADREDIARYLDDAKSSLLRRDAYAHSLWPAFSLEHGTTVVGWRTKQGAPDLHLGEELAELREDVLKFSELVMRWNLKIHLAMAPLPWLQSLGDAS